MWFNWLSFRGQVTDLLKAPMDNAISSLHQLDGLGMRSLVISSVGLGIANSRVQLKKMMDNTLLSVQASRLGVDVGALVDRTVVDLTKLGALRVGRTEVRNVSVLMSTTGNAPDVSTPNSTKRKLTVFSNTLLEVSRLGKAAMKGISVVSFSCLSLKMIKILTIHILYKENNNCSNLVCHLFLSPNFVFFLFFLYKICCAMHKVLLERAILLI